MNNTKPLGFHDAELVGIELDRVNKCARLEFRLESGQQRSINLLGLKAFRSEDFTLQNVVSRLLLSSSGEFDRDRLERWLSWATSLSDASSWLSGQGKQEWRDACEAGALELIVIEPSAGAQLAAVCEKLNIS